MQMLENVKHSLVEVTFDIAHLESVKWLKILASWLILIVRDKYAYCALQAVWTVVQTLAALLAAHALLEKVVLDCFKDAHNNLLSPST